ncbi:MAG: hypothetical protein JO225_16745 [Candidatus Eremiobacteraeota bacterium]|nr:hypothetical protein [Candidatus Eremiobacteraeota bacterium]
MPSFDTGLAEELQAIAPGGYVLFGPTASPEVFSSVSHQLRAIAAPRPAFIAVDQEGGAVQRIALTGRLPSPMALAATRSTVLACAFGEHLGHLARLGGADTIFGPVLDLAAKTSPLGTRAFSDEVALVAELGCAVARGISSVGVRSVVKHFPGYSFAAGDPEQGEAIVRMPWPDVWKRSKQFSKVYPSAGHAVMTSHAIYSDLDPENPGTLSPMLLGILRSAMPNAMVISDALDMPAITKHLTIGEAAVAAINAGVDCLLFSHLENTMQAVDGLIAALRSGTISATRLEAAARRVRSFTERLMLAERVRPAKVLELTTEISSNSISATNGATAIKSAHVAIVTFSNASAHIAIALANCLARSSTAIAVTVERWESAGHTRTPGRPDATYRLALIDRRLPSWVISSCVQGLRGSRFALVSLESPYDAAAFADSPTFFTYGEERAQIEALVKILAEGQHVLGQLPVLLR